ncbi:MAG: Uma2 family endonuclease [Thermomicrobiales bacterium]|nr:Uma2 family endonuclease [Thermomicrobiales bacterium]
MSTRFHPLTYADLERARETSQERIELIEGELYVTASPSLKHQDVSALFNAAFREAVARPGLGRVYYAPVDVRLAEHTIVQPDLVVVLSDRSHILTPARIEGAPSLVVEILSPSTSAYDRETKRQTYARHDVPEYWMVDAKRATVTVCSDPRDGCYQRDVTFNDVAVSATIPRLSVDLEELFASVPDF